MRTDSERPEDLGSNRLLLTTGKAAHVLRVGRTTVYTLIKEGQLRPVHIGRSCRSSRAELERYVNRLDAPPPIIRSRPQPRKQTSVEQRTLFEDPSSARPEGCRTLPSSR